MRSLHRLKTVALIASACRSNVSSSFSIGSDTSARSSLLASNHSARFTRMKAFSGDGSGGPDWAVLTGNGGVVVGLRGRGLLPGLSMRGESGLEDFEVSVSDSYSLLLILIGIVIVVSADVKCFSTTSVP
jgi:hypothetical protein